MNKENGAKKREVTIACLRFQMALGRIGILICMDRYYPEAALTLAAKGAEIILMPSTSNPTREEVMKEIAGGPRAPAYPMLDIDAIKSICCGRVPWIVPAFGRRRIRLRALSSISGDGSSLAATIAIPMMRSLSRPRLSRIRNGCAPSIYVAAGRICAISKYADDFPTDSSRLRPSPR